MPDSSKLFGLSLNEATVFLFADAQGNIPFPKERDTDQDAVLVTRLGNLVAKGYVRRKRSADGGSIFQLTRDGIAMKAKLEKLQL
jgi:hypothetical protein